MRYVPRLLENRLSALLRTFPAVLVYGPRQCGKSTLVRHLLPEWRYVDLERQVDIRLLTSDLEGFLDANPRRLILDEAQRLPEIFPQLRHHIDRSRAKGRFVLLGSASPGLMRTASETLSGRLGLLELTPFLVSELRATAHARDRWFWGGYPPIYERRTGRQRVDWLDNYVATFLERDLPLLGFSLPAPRLRTLCSMITHVHGNLLNVADLARSLAVSSHTVSSYLDVLESTFFIRRLPPYFANIQKRLTKSPKLYVRDTGLLHFLADLRRPADLATWPRRGSSFEGLVIEELSALAARRLVRPGLFFWRTQTGSEVDLLVVSGRRIFPIEVKIGSAVDHYSVAGLRGCMKDLSLKRGWVITTGRERARIGTNVEVVPWEHIVRGEVTIF